MSEEPLYTGSQKLRTRTTVGFYTEGAGVGGVAEGLLPFCAYNSTLRNLSDTIRETN